MNTPHKMKKSASLALMVSALTVLPMSAKAGILDTVKGWFGGASQTSSDYRTPGFVPNGSGQAGASSGDAVSKALCDDLGSQLAQSQANAINQRAAIKSLSKSLSEFGLNSILGNATNGAQVLGNVRNVATEAAKQYVQQETNKQINPQAQSPSMNTLR